MRRLTTLFPFEFLKEHAEFLGVVERDRKLQIPAFVWAFVFGFAAGESQTLAGFRRSYNSTADETISPSGFYHRLTPTLAEYLHDLVERGLDEVAVPNAVDADLDQCGVSASKLWNVGRYYIQDRWDEDGEIPDEAELKSELKDHERYNDLHSQSSQRVLEELAEPFTGWYNSDDGNSPPGYRKRGDDHPRSTVTWKQKRIKHDDKHGQICLSGGWNLKDGRSDFILAEYETRPDVTVENIQQVRAVWNGDEWRLHIVCEKQIPVEDAPGDNTAGIDLGISNSLAIDYEDGRTLGALSGERAERGQALSHPRGIPD